MADVTRSKRPEPPAGVSEEVRRSVESVMSGVWDEVDRICSDLETWAETGEMPEGADSGEAVASTATEAPLGEAPSEEADTGSGSLVEERSPDTEEDAFGSVPNTEAPEVAKAPEAAEESEPESAAVGEDEVSALMEESPPQEEESLGEALPEEVLDEPEAPPDPPVEPAEDLPAPEDSPQPPPAAAPDSKGPVDDEMAELEALIESTEEEKSAVAPAEGGGEGAVEVPSATGREVAGIADEEGGGETPRASARSLNPLRYAVEALLWVDRKVDEAGLGPYRPWIGRAGVGMIAMSLAWWTARLIFALMVA